MSSAVVTQCLKDKFRGCLVGALVGDCLGSYFEIAYRHVVDPNELSRHIDRSENDQGENIFLTDDTQMTQELADSLIAQKNVDVHDLARRFTDRYYLDGDDKGYGQHVVEVFSKLKKSEFKDPLQPAREQFGGKGSLGNGAAMRVAPAALFGYPDLTETANIADKSGAVTHSNYLGLHGAVFQALAIRRALLKPVEDPFKFINELKADFIKYGMVEEYMEKLMTIEKALKKGTVSDTYVEAKLGNGVRALRSVPTALFCFLYAMQPIEEVPTSNVFRRTVQYAISLGGDTDTIASMAGALAGAHLGLSQINRKTVEACPDWEKAISQADSIWELVSHKTS